MTALLSIPVLLPLSLILAVSLPFGSGEIATCQSISASLPPQCPETIGPPCPRCYTNTMPDYTPGASLELSAAARNAIQQHLPDYLDRLLQLFPVPDRSFSGDPTVFSGAGGEALLFLKLYRLTRNDTYLDLSRTYIDASVRRLPQQKLADEIKGYSGFFWSHSGILAVAAVVYDTLGQETDKVRSWVAELDTLAASAAGRYDDFDSGRAGLLFACAFANAHVSDPTARVASDNMLALAQAIIESGRAHAPPGVPYLAWISPNDGERWLGASHGSAGVLFSLLRNAPAALWQNATATGLVRATLDHIVASQFPTGNFPAEYFNATDDVLTQWDHGSPGVSAALFAANDVLRDNTYLASAMRAQDDAWHRGILTKGLMLCHGISGVTYTMLMAHRSTNNATYLYRALRLQEFVLSEPKLSDPNQMRVPQPASLNEDLWVGNYPGAILLWSDLFFGNASQASMTGFEVAF